MSERKTLKPQECDAIAGLAASWLRQDLTATPTDKVAIEQEIGRAYEASGLKAPAMVCWAASPLEGVLTVAIIRTLAKRHNLRTLSSRDRVINKITRKVERATVKSMRSALDPHLALEAAEVIHQEVLKSSLPAFREAFMRYQSLGSATFCFCVTCTGTNKGESIRKSRKNAHAALANGLSARNRLHTAYWAPLQVELNRALLAGVPADGSLETRINDVIQGLPSKLKEQVLKKQAAGSGANKYDYLYPLLRKYVGRAQRVRGLRGGIGHPGLLGSYRLTFGHWQEIAPMITGVDFSKAGAKVFNNSAVRLWSYKNFAVVTQNPTSISVDPQGRLHDADGPCVKYADGFNVYSWHGTPVPQSLIETNWSPEQIFGAPNAEIRRCAIEKMGWEAFIQSAGLNQVGAGYNDPGNPGERLFLYDVPENLMRDVRVLICTNATKEPDGERRRFGLTVPRRISDPIEAAAWTFGIPVEDYRKLQRAC